MKYVYLVSHCGPVGERTVGIYSTFAKANASKRTWDKKCRYEWDLVVILKIKIDPVTPKAEKERG